MAFRRRRLRRPRGGLNRPAGPFANAERGGRSLQWVGLNAASLAVVAPAVTFTANAINYNCFAMAPASGSLKGVHTLERIRGSLQYYTTSSGIINTAALLWHSIQVVRLGPADTLTFNDTTIATFDQLAMDAQSIVYSHIIAPIAVLDGVLFNLQGTGRDDGLECGNVDMKTRRRIDFSQYALVNVLAHPNLAITRIGLQLRGLFRAAGNLG